MKSKIVDIDLLKKICEEKKTKGHILVATSGCFDIIHSGHVNYLEEAKGLGDCLIVFLNSDSSVKKLKGAERPIVPENERAFVLAGLESIDYICVFDQQTPCEMISCTHPDIFVKGGDYFGKHIPEMDEVGKYGGRLAYLSMTDGCSSTNIIEKIKRGVSQ